MNNKEALSVVNETQERFVKLFDVKWSHFLTTINMKYTDAKQLHIGNRMRPFLVYWGFALCNSDASDHIDLITDIAVSLEAVHKASVIIDDLIDEDTKRRGVDSFHIEYSPDESMLFAVCMLSKAIDHINKILPEISSLSIRGQAVSVICDTIFTMCSGALLEITSTDAQRKDMKNIQEIIQLETVSLLRNSLYMGYLVSGAENLSAEKCIREIGSKCGYIFQVVNDLEPFCNPDHIEKSKGALNSDCLRSKKNIVIPYLYLAVSLKDKLLLDKLLKQAASFDDIKKLFDKYNIKMLIFKDLRKISTSLFGLTKELISVCPNKVWANAFYIFLTSLQENYLSILNRGGKEGC